jgi:hypothetical protein
VKRHAVNTPTQLREHNTVSSLQYTRNFDAIKAYFLKVEVLVLKLCRTVQQQAGSKERSTACPAVRVRRPNVAQKIVRMVVFTFAGFVQA